MRKILLTSVLPFLFAAPVWASDMDVAGIWWTQDKDAKVEITDCGDGTPCGSLIWTEEENPLDGNNPDPALRDKPLIGAKMFWGFKAKKDKWTGGKIYDARSGKTYKSKLKLNEDGSLNLKGCIAFICQGETWTRAAN